MSEELLGLANSRGRARNPNDPRECGVRARKGSTIEGEGVWIPGRGEPEDSELEDSGQRVPKV